MENSGRQSELMKPIILKAGIPLALSLAGFLYSMITSRKKLHVGRATEEGHQVSQNDETEAQDDNRDHNSTQGLNSTSLLACTEGRVHMGNIQTKDSYISLQIRYRPETEEEILGLMKQVKALQDKEQELERRFVSFCGFIKEQELALTKLQNLLVLKQAHLDFLGMTIESREAERRKFELMVVEYLRVLKQLESARLDNGMLQKKAKKLRKYSNIVLRQASMLQAREAEISTSHEELQGKTQVIVELNHRIMVLEILVDKYQQEKKELAEKLELAETSASSVSKKESEDTGVYVHDQLITELEQLQKDRAAEAEELVYLRWINACFRHELTRNQEEEHEHEHEERDDSIVLEDEVKHGILRYNSDPSSTIADQDESRALIMTTSHKKPKLLGKLRRWVRGSEACRRSWQHEHLYVKIRSVSHGRLSSI